MLGRDLSLDVANLADMLGLMSQCYSMGCVESSMPRFQSETQMNVFLSESTWAADYFC